MRTYVRFGFCCPHVGSVHHIAMKCDYLCSGFRWWFWCTRVSERANTLEIESDRIKVCAFFCHFSHTSKTNQFFSCAHIHLRSSYVVESYFFSRTFSLTDTRTHFLFGLIIHHNVFNTTHSNTHAYHQKGWEQTPFHLCRRFILYFCYFRYCQCCVLWVWYLIFFLSPFFFVFLFGVTVVFLFCSLCVYFDIHWVWSNFDLNSWALLRWCLVNNRQRHNGLHCERREKESVNDLARSQNKKKLNIFFWQMQWDQLFIQVCKSVYLLRKCERIRDSAYIFLLNIVQKYQPESVYCCRWFFFLINFNTA